jgi:hypothetical protein
MTSVCDGGYNNMLLGLDRENYMYYTVCTAVQ